MIRKVNHIKRIAALLLALLLALSSMPAALAETFSAIVTASSMEVFRDEKMSEPLGSLAKNTVVRVTSVDDGAAKITFNGRTGYAASADMDAVSSMAKRGVTAAASKVYTSPNRGSASATVGKGTHLYVLATNNGWALVEMNGNVGYIETDRLVEADEAWNPVVSNEDDEDDIEYQVAALDASSAQTGYAISDVKVYSKASASAKLLGTLRKNQTVKVLAYNKTWAYIERNGNRGYCQVRYLKQGTPPASATPTVQAQGSVKVASLPVYKTASTRSTKLGTLKKGVVVNVIRWNSTWAYIELNGRYGYTAVNGLKKVSAAAQPSVTPAPTAAPSLDNAIKAVVSETSVTVFESAATGSAILGTLRQGTQVNIVAASGNWAQIELNGRYGYCKLSALTQSEIKTAMPEDFKKENFDATVVVSGARAFASANTASESVTLALGATVQVVAYSSDWACISRNGTYAFVPVSNLSRASYSAVGASGSALQTLLKALLSYGYYDGVPTTTYNTAASTAIKRFQSACGLKQTGIADQTMQRILYSGYAPLSSLLTTPLAKGSKGASVTRMQTRLYALKYFSKTSSVDGDYGSNTAGAVSLFQSANGLTATGSADVNTLKAMYALNAVAAGSGSAADTSVSIPTPKTTSTYMTYMPGNTAGKVTSYSSSLSNAQKLEYAIYVASTKLKCPYVYGATGPSKFDCSGLTGYCFKAIGVSLPRTAYQQGYQTSYAKIESVGRLKRGDLVFFNTVSDSDLCDHVGIYLGSGYFIHASSGGHKVVTSQLASGYYNRVFSWGRRVLN